MTDHFAVLGIPRAACLDPDGLKERFHRLGAQHHPDVPDGSAQAFTEVNAAWHTLSDPSKCLRHYLELEHPECLAGIDRTPAELAGLFMDIAAFRQDVQRFANQHDAAGSPLSRALLEPDRLKLRARLESLDAGVIARIDGIKTALRQGGLLPCGLANLLASLVFLGKWSTHLAEARTAL